MALLGTDPSVVFDQRHPAEHRLLSYVARMAAQMTEPFDPERHVRVTPFFFGPEPAWGPIPFESDVLDVESLEGRLLRSMWEAVSAGLRAEHPGARRYAEKLAVPVAPIIDAGIDLRVIDLLRDPRDVLASVRAFVATTGVDGFGQRPGRTPQDEVADFIRRFGGQLHAMGDMPNGPGRLIVRYEDLASDPHATAEQLGSWLGLELDADRALERIAVHGEHRTTSTVEASIGRWRRDLAPDEAELIERELGPLMAPYGYDL